MTKSKETRKHALRWLWIGLSAGALALVAIACLGLGLALVLSDSTQPREAPEAERVLTAQSSLPFQVLLPAYLPARFNREHVQILHDQTGPLGEVMVQLVYSHPLGVKLVLSEWVSLDAPPAGQAEAVAQVPTGSVRPCNCPCSSHTASSGASSDQCDLTRLMVDAGPLRVMAESSNLELLPRSLMQTILGTLAPAAGLMTYSTLDQVPQTSALPPAVQIPIDSNGIQEVKLVVSSSGYTPAHFAVKQGIPVRLTFRQFGYVGCGNELLIAWGPEPQHQGHLLLASTDDMQTLEFTPQTIGDFPFHCPHMIYTGVMSVQE